MGSNKNVLKIERNLSESEAGRLKTKPIKNGPAIRLVPKSTGPIKLDGLGYLAKPIQLTGLVYLARLSLIDPSH